MPNQLQRWDLTLALAGYTGSAPLGCESRENCREQNCLRVRQQVSMDKTSNGSNVTPERVLQDLCSMNILEQPIVRLACVVQHTNLRTGHGDDLLFPSGFKRGEGSMTNGLQSIRSAAWRRTSLAPKAKGCFPMFDSGLRYRGIVGRLRDLPWGGG